jgi:hypothetical protein
MTHCDATGYLASGLVLAAFGMKDMAKLRMVAIASNLVFLAYGLSLDLAPVWILHAVLLPLNVWRLTQALQLTRRQAKIGPRYEAMERRRQPSRVVSTSQAAA